MKTIFVGPLPNPITGQAVCFKKIVDQYPEERRIVIDNFKYRNKVLSTLYVYLRTMMIFLLSKRKLNCIYMTCSRSLLGFIKDMPVLLLGKIRKIRIVNHLHGSDFGEFAEHFPSKKFLLWLYRQTETIVLMDAMKEQFAIFPTMKIWTVPNFYDELFDSYKDKFKKNSGQVLFLSNLMKSKGIIEFIESADKILMDDRLNIVIAGAFMGDKYMSEQAIRDLLEPKFLRLSEKYGKRFSYKGFVNGNEKAKLYAESDVFILPSYTEGFPISIIEAMRMGCTILTTDVDYLLELITTKNGTIIPFDAINDMSKYVWAEFKSEGALLQKQAYNVDLAKSNYSEKKYVERLKQILEN